MKTLQQLVASYQQERQTSEAKEAAGTFVYDFPAFEALADYCDSSINHAETMRQVRSIAPEFNY